MVQVSLDDVLAASTALVTGLLAYYLVYTFSGPWATALIILVVSVTATSLYRGEGKALYSLAAACIMFFADVFVHEGGHYVAALIAGYRPVIGLFGISTAMIEITGDKIVLVSLDEIPVAKALGVTLAGPAIGIFFLYLLHYVFNVPVGGLIALELSNLFPFPLLADGQTYPLSDGSKALWLLGVKLPGLDPLLYWGLLTTATLAAALALTRLETGGLT